MPQGAFYVFPEIDLDYFSRRWQDDNQFVLDLLNSTGVLTVHGSGFGTAFGGGHFRIVYLPTEDVLEEAMDRMEGFIT
jgi:aspartate/methionine/tyrosine aminotransferase